MATKNTEAEQRQYAHVDVDEAIAAWDMDGEGHISALEMAIARDKQLGLESQQGGQANNKLICLVVTIALVVIATMLAVTMLANELSKDTKPRDGVLEDTSQRAVATDAVHTKNMPLVDTLSTMSVEELRSVVDIDLYDVTRDHHYHLKVGGFKHIGPGHLEIYPTTTHYNRVTVNKGVVSLYRGSGQERTIISVAATSPVRRRLMGANDVTATLTVRGQHTGTNGVAIGASNKKTSCFCHLNSQYRAGNNANPAISPAPYAPLCVDPKHLDAHITHGDIDMNGSFGASADKLNDAGKALAGLFGTTGINNMFFDENCVVADPCNDDAVASCVSAGQGPCVTGINSADCTTIVLPPSDDGDSGTGGR